MKKRGGKIVGCSSYLNPTVRTLLKRFTESGSVDMVHAERELLLAGEAVQERSKQFAKVDE